LLLCQQLFFYRDLWVWLDDPFQSPQALAGVHDDARADMVEMPGTGAQLWLNWFLVDLNPAYQGAQSLSPVAIPSVRPAVSPQMWKATLSGRLNAYHVSGAAIVLTMNAGHYTSYKLSTHK
jgi:hypothetical protein